MKADLIKLCVSPLPKPCRTSRTNCLFMCVRIQPHFSSWAWFGRAWCQIGVVEFLALQLEPLGRRIPRLLICFLWWFVLLRCGFADGAALPDSNLLVRVCVCHKGAGKMITPIAQIIVYHSPTNPVLGCSRKRAIQYIVISVQNIPDYHLSDARP